MIEHLSNRDGMMKDNALALRVLEALRDLDASELTSDDAWTYIDDTPTTGFDINAFGGLYANDDLLHISLYRCVLHPDGYIRVVSHDEPMGSATPIAVISVDVDYPTLIIYKTWQYDTELFTRLVADAGFPHLCKDISIGQNAVSFIDWSATEEKE